MTNYKSATNLNPKNFLWGADCYWSVVQWENRFPITSGSEMVSP